MIVQTLGRGMSLIILACILFIGASAPALAADPIDPSVCTTMSQRADDLLNAAPPGPDEPPGVLTEIFGFIKDVTVDATENIFSTFVDNSSYRTAVGAILTLYIAIFGAMFMMGIVQATFGQVLMRLIKFGIIATLLTSGWVFFNGYVVNFFNNGTDQLIRAVMDIAAGMPPGSTPANVSPFYRIDRIASFLIHPDTIVAIMGSATSGVYSFGMTGLMLLAFFGFVKLLVTALQTYAVSFVVRSLLLGLAPIFFVFLLFERTKGLFTGWINLLVSFSLNPILLFTFLSFMVVMIQTATVNMMNVELCWATVTQEQSGQGMNKQKQFWRFLDKTKNPPEPVLLDWDFDGSQQCRIASGAAVGQDCPQFPIKIIDVLTFFLLVWLAMRFSEVIERISNELSSAVASLSADTKLMHYLSKDDNAASSAPSAAAVNVRRAAEDQVTGRNRPAG